MYRASLKTVPSIPVFFARSDPARSTRWSFERRTVEPPTGRLSSSSVKMQCEREEASFIDVADTSRLVSPSKSSVSASSSERATCDERPRTRTDAPFSSSTTPCTRGSSARPRGPPASRLPDDDARSSRSKPASL